MAERWYIYGWHKAAASDAPASGVTSAYANADDDGETSTVATGTVPSDRIIDSDHMTPSEGYCTHAQQYALCDQVYVIIRSDTSATSGQSPEAVIGLVKTLWAYTEGESEVERLNQSSHYGGSVYFWKAARLERRVAAM